MDAMRVLAAAVEQRQGFRYTEELRERLTAYARDARGRGANWHQLGKELGVSSKTLHRWVGRSGGPARFVAVRPTATKGTGLALVSPAGWRIEGLSVSDVATLLREVRP